MTVSSMTVVLGAIALLLCCGLVIFVGVWRYTLEVERRIEEGRTADVDKRRRRAPGGLAAA
jgi:hypothetical protein